MSASPRTEAIAAIQEAVGKLGKYEFHRGDFQWKDHDYGQTPRVAYLMVMSAPLEFGRENTPTLAAEAQLVLVKGLVGSSVAPSSLDDLLVDELSDDAAWILAEAARATYDDGQTFKVAFDSTNATVQEFHSVGFDIQGIAVSFVMRF